MLQIYQRYKRFHELSIKDSEVVLDVGSGHHPFPRADILLDISVEGSRKNGRPFIQADICNLPFHDKSIDFVYCSHVLEHVTDPGKALNEIQRIGLRGYIVVPSALWEVLFGDDRNHKWFIEKNGNQLIFSPKDEVFFSYSERIRCLMKKLFKLQPKIMGKFYRESFPLWAIEYKWHENIYFKVKSGTPMDMGGGEFWNDIPYPKSVMSCLYDYMCSFEARMIKFRRRTKQIDLIAFLRCPVCKRKLIQVRKGFCCQGCGRIFPIKNGVIKMLPE